MSKAQVWDPSVGHQMRQGHERRAQEQAFQELSALWPEGGLLMQKSDTVGGEAPDDAAHSEQPGSHHGLAQQQKDWRLKGQV